MAFIVRRGSGNWLSQISIDKGYAIKVIEHQDGTQSYELISGGNGDVHVLGYEVQVVTNPDGSESYNIVSGASGTPLVANNPFQMLLLLNRDNIDKIVLYTGATTEEFDSNSYYVIDDTIHFTPLFRTQTVYGYDIKVIENFDGSETYNIRTDGAGLPVVVNDLREVTTDSNVGKVYEYNGELYVITE